MDPRILDPGFMMDKRIMVSGGCFSIVTTSDSRIESDSTTSERKKRVKNKQTEVWRKLSPLRKLSYSVNTALKKT